RRGFLSGRSGGDCGRPWTGLKSQAISGILCIDLKKRRLCMTPLVQRIDEFLVNRRKERDISYKAYAQQRGYRLPPYLAGNCTRRAVYTLLGFPEPDMTPGALRIIENGNSMQERYQAWLKDAGLLLHKEYPVSSDELLISGRCDGILFIDQKLYVLELKTTGLFNFQEMARTKQPDPEYKDQLMLYMHLTEIPN